MQPEVLKLDMMVTRGGGWSLALLVTDNAGIGLDLTGKTATITLDGTVSWNASVVGSTFVWDIPKTSVDALTIDKVGVAVLTVADGANVTVWAKGKVTVQ